jgi:DNA replication and repair protein RecF
LDKKVVQRGPLIYISHLSLLNFRNYERLELDLEPGMVLVQGGNGQGKSNLLEALYMLAIAKSPRASADREVIRRQGTHEETHAQVSAVAERDGGRVRVQIDLTSKPSTEGAKVQGPDQQDTTGASVQKYLRVNGVPRRSSELVGEINAVMFSAQDLDLVLGSPVVRRRYLDILISQVNTRYLKALQKYQRVVSQRNHLLRTVREGRSRPGELEFWDDELVVEGSYIMAQRAETVLTLSQRAGPIHRELAGEGEGLELVFRPSVETVAGASAEQVGQSLRRALERQRDREVAQGFTVCGPHRDDLQMLLDNMDAGIFASRGQCRTVALAMKLAEADYLRDRRGQEPILLLDDVLSELDAARRAHVLDRACQYQQCFITTTDVEPIEEKYLSRMSRFVVSGGRVEPVGAVDGN